MIRPGIRRLLSTRGRRAAEEEVDEEIRLHLELRSRQLREEGLSEADAEREARERFGMDPSERRALRNAASRRSRRLAFRDRLGGWLNDVGYALRQLRNSPAFALTAITVIALGVGATTSIFAAVDAALLRPPAGVRAPDELFAIYTSDYSGPAFGGSSFPDFLDVRSGSSSFTDAAAFFPVSLTLEAGTGSEVVSGELVTDNFFELLGVDPRAGRFFVPTASTSSPEPEVVISHGLWQRAFGGDRQVAGEAVRINGQLLTVVGIAPEGFAGPTGRQSADLWVPIGMERLLIPSGSVETRLTERAARWLRIVARLEASSSAGIAEQQLQARSEALFDRYPEAWTDVAGSSRRFTMIGAKEAGIPPSARGAVVGFFGILGGLVMLVLMIACANVANLLMVRATRRHSEMAVRLAIGASRWRLARQLLTESLVLAAAGGLAGVAVAWLLIRGLATAELPLPSTVLFAPIMDVRVLTFSLGLTFATALLFGLLPTLMTIRRDPATALRDGSSPGSRRGTRFRSALVAGQIGTCVVLVVCALLFVGSLRNAVTTELGIEVENVLLQPLNLAAAGYDDTRTLQFADELLERLENRPGIEAVALADMVPLTGRYQRRGMRPEGYQRAEGEDMEVDFAVVTPEYLRVMGIALLTGRPLQATDRAGSPRVALVNEAYARRFWEGENPVGKRIIFRVPGQDEPEQLEVVGLVTNFTIRELGESPRPAFMIPFAQEPVGDPVVHLKTTRNPDDFLQPLREELREVDPSLVIAGASTLEEALGEQSQLLRVASFLFAGLGIVALVIAAVGLYGLLSFSIAQRTREIGIRIALGAGVGSVRATVVRTAGTLVGIGGFLGLVATWFAARLISGFLFEVGDERWMLVGLATLLVSATAILAALVSARRATAIDPLTALRAE